jgi:hypothetical protein
MSKGRTGQPQPYHGYDYRIPSRRRARRRGGIDYLVNGRMIGGSVVAYPAKYGVSGVMTFVVNHDGAVTRRTRPIHPD